MTGPSGLFEELCRVMKERDDAMQRLSKAEEMESRLRMEIGRLKNAATSREREARDTDVTFRFDEEQVMRLFNLILKGLAEGMSAWVEKEKAKEE